MNIQRNPAVCGGYMCDLETSYRSSRPNLAVQTKETVAADEPGHIQNGIKKINFMFSLKMETTLYAIFKQIREMSVPLPEPCQNLA